MSTRTSIPARASFPNTGPRPGCPAAGTGLRRAAGGASRRPARPPALDGPFVPIYREMTGEIESAVQALAGGSDAGDAVRGSGGGRHFYLAVHKQELGARWFLSAYLTQIHPGGVGSGAGASLGTRIVSFRVQNGKLFLFDAADGNVWSETFRPGGAAGGLPHRPGVRRPSRSCQGPRTTCWSIRRPG